jgi:hypothetical protein
LGIYADYSPSEREREWVEVAFGCEPVAAAVSGAPALEG